MTMGEMSVKIAARFMGINKLKNILIFNRKQVGHYSLRVCERKDRVVWQGFTHAGAAIGRCCVLNWTVLQLKILN